MAQRAFATVSLTAQGRWIRYIGPVRGLPEQQGVHGRVLGPVWELPGSPLGAILGPSGLQKWSSEVIYSHFWTFRDQKVVLRSDLLVIF